MDKYTIIKYNNYNYIISPNKEIYKLILLTDNKNNYRIIIKKKNNELKKNKLCQVICEYDFIHSAISDFIYSNFSKIINYKKYDMHLNMPNSDIILENLKSGSITSDVIINKIDKKYLISIFNN